MFCLDLGAIFFLGSGPRGVSRTRIVLGICTYFGLYFSLMFLAPAVCSIALPRSGTFLHGDYDALGYRLGVCAISASFLSAMATRWSVLQQGVQSRNDNSTRFDATACNRH